jgi:hypothetical protein
VGGGNRYCEIRDALWQSVLTKAMAQKGRFSVDDDDDDGYDDRLVYDK